MVAIPAWLVDKERAHLLRLRACIDRWWPDYARANPEAERQAVVRQLTDLIAQLPVAKFERRRAPPPAPSGPPPLRGRAVLEPSQRSPYPRVRPTYTLPPACAPASGDLLASRAKKYAAFGPSLADTNFRFDTTPRGAADWPGAFGATFWAGFSRFDPQFTLPTTKSASDLAAQALVFEVTFPTPGCASLLSYTTDLIVYLPKGCEIVDQWGVFDDKDNGELKIELGFGTGADFPDDLATMQWTTPIDVTSSTASGIWAQQTAAGALSLGPNQSLKLYLGLRVTTDGADCRVQTGFTQDTEDAYFELRVSDSVTESHAFNGVHYNLDPVS